MKNKKNNKIVKLRIYTGGKSFYLERDEDWNINITPVAKYLGKNWQDWYKYHKKKIRGCEIQLSIKRVVKATRGRHGTTWITFELAHEVLSSWSYGMAFQLSNYYRKR